MSAKGITLTFHTDPGHGWLEIEKQLVIELGIAPKISRFSYVLGTRMFLEEDCDAGLAIDALKARGYEVGFKEVVHTNNQHWIRNLNRFE